MIDTIQLFLYAIRSYILSGLIWVQAVYKGILTFLKQAFYESLDFFKGS